MDLAPPSTSGTLHVKSRDFEVKDTQWLSALLAKSFPDIDPDAVAVTGGSYGGGESWVQASQPTWDFPNSQDLSLPVLKLQVAVPKYPWTDLSYALAPSGHGDPYSTSQGHPDSDTGNGYPTGVPKASYISGLFASGTANGKFEDENTNPAFTGEEGPISISAWNLRLTGGGDLYLDADPVVAQARRGLTEFRSAYHRDKQWEAEAQGRRVAVFSIQGWTDDLFEGVESFRMFKYLKAKDPRWPVEVALGDIGHSRAQNKPATWQRLNAQAFQWLQSNINGSHDRSTTVSSEPTVCDDSAPAMRLTAKTPEGLSAGTLRVTYAGGTTLTNESGSGDPDSLTTDAIAGGAFDDATGNQGPCAGSSAPIFPGRYTGTSDTLKNERPYIGPGTVTVPYTLAGAVAELNARVWDVPPGGGKALLVTRGTYRLDTATTNDPDTATGTLTLPLYGNHWRLAPGHRIRLDLAEVNAPPFLPTNTGDELPLGDPVLTRSADERAWRAPGPNAIQPGPELASSTRLSPSPARAATGAANLIARAYPPHTLLSPTGLRGALYGAPHGSPHLHAPGRRRRPGPPHPRADRLRRRDPAVPARRLRRVRRLELRRARRHRHADHRSRADRADPRVRGAQGGRARQRAAARAAGAAEHLRRGGQRRSGVGSPARGQRPADPRRRDGRVRGAAHRPPARTRARLACLRHLVLRARGHRRVGLEQASSASMSTAPPTWSVPWLNTLKPSPPVARNEFIATR